MEPSFKVVFGEKSTRGSHEQCTDPQKKGSRTKKHSKHAIQTLPK